MLACLEGWFGSGQPTISPSGQASLDGSIEAGRWMVPGGWAGVVLFASGVIADTLGLELPDLMDCQVGGAVAVPTMSTDIDGSSIGTADANMGSQCPTLGLQSILLPVSSTPLPSSPSRDAATSAARRTSAPILNMQQQQQQQKQHDAFPILSSSPKEHSPSPQSVPEKEMQRNLSTLAIGASHMSCFPNLGAQRSHHHLREPRKGNSSTRSDGSTPQQQTTELVDDSIRVVGDRVARWCSMKRGTAGLETNTPSTLHGYSTLLYLFL